MQFNQNRINSIKKQNQITKHQIFSLSELIEKLDLKPLDVKIN